jgi:hypothetical protein
MFEIRREALGQLVPTLLAHRLLGEVSCADDRQLADLL